MTSRYLLSKAKGSCVRSGQHLPSKLSYWARFRLWLDPFRRMALLLSFLVSVSGALSPVPIHAGAPNYVYDDAGRLIAVIDPTSDTAVYIYDAVGNLLSITQQPSSQLAIFNFTPKSGPIGTVVTIYGTGFSATPSQNTVTFNGTAATVTAATTTQIVTSVPGSATTGTITIATPSGSATSSASFTVTNAGAPAAPPTITGFTPTIGVPGASVTITGTNFSPTFPDNQVVFTATQSTVSASTSTTITTSAPSVRASGHITVATPSGAVISTDDFFIPPGTYAVADVGATGRMTIGQSQLVSIASNKIALIVFDGVASQRMSIRTSGATMGAVSVVVRDPYGTTLKNVGLGGPDGFIDPFTIPTTGTYTISIDPSGTAAGSLTVILHDVPADISGVIAPNGSPVTITTTVPGQNGLLNFDGTAGQRVSLQMTNSSFGGNCVYARILDPTNTSVAFQCLTSSNNFLEPVSLPLTGSYTLVLDPAGVTTGSATFTLYDVPADVTSPITPGGSSVTVTLTAPGQNALLTFTGAIGQRVSALINSSTITNCSTVEFRLLKPGGGFTSVGGGVCAGAFLQPQTLTEDGTYTLLINPSSTNTGQATVTVYNVTDVTGSITPGGSSVTTTISIPGQTALLAFSGAANQRVSLLVNSKTFPSCGTVRILNPDGTTLDSISGCANSFLDVTTLPVTGTYNVQIDPANEDTGQSTVTLYDVPADVTGTLVINDPATTVTITTPGQNGQLTFNGTAAQLVTVRMTGNTIGTTAIKLLKPDGTQLGSVTSSSASFNMAQKTLPTTGTYTVVIDPSGTRTGSIGVRVTNP